MIELTPEEYHVIIDKGTEKPFSGLYYNHKKQGIYVCKLCQLPLYYSKDKFDSHCGWPSFDDEIPMSIKRTPDKDGHRTEITCNRCGAHLGHVFTGEGFTEKNTRHCVNSISMYFIPTENDSDVEIAIFGGGCFWGMEYYLQKLSGVINVVAGYMGGTKRFPTYEEVCTGTTGYTEVVQVIYDKNKTDFETVAKYFFEIHDPTQLNRQGPDVGYQYRSVIFYNNQTQKEIAEKLIQILVNKGYSIVTTVDPATIFWKAESYHQSYYQKKGGMPYCHKYTKRF